MGEVGGIGSGDSGVGNSNTGGGGDDGDNGSEEEITVDVIVDGLFCLIVAVLGGEEVILLSVATAVTNAAVAAAVSCAKDKIAMSAATRSESR